MTSPIAALTTTPAGLKALAPLCDQPDIDLWISDSLRAHAQDLGIQHQVYGGSLANFLSAEWLQREGFIFCLANGAVVRLVAPLLQNKKTDPAVVVIDSLGQFAISLCGGHQGGADRLTQRVSQLLSAQSVLTGAATTLHLPAIDMLGQPFGWQRGEGDWLGVSRAIAHHQPVQIIQEAGSGLWQQHLPEGHTFQFGFPEFEERNQQPQPSARVWISPTKRRFSPPTGSQSEMPKVQWHPRVLWVGIGCERGTDEALIRYALETVLKTNHLAIEAVAGVATLDLKADEAGLLAFVQAKDWSLQCFSPDTLSNVAVPNPSSVVQNAVGTPSVAEAAALRAAQQQQGPDNLTDVNCKLRVTKQVVKQSDYAGAVTVAIAQSPVEFLDRTGNLHLVGIGPGSLSQITPAASAAITNADAVIGYKLYVDLVRSLLRPNQIVEALPITQERQRAERAIALAQWGLTVAVISSGDCGIYGMAGLVLEQLKAQNWDGKTPDVKVFPGVSALQSAASRVGAPLMHDFCAISLSDLLTPWPIIQKRLQSAAAGDFIVALYNPKSKTRTTQIAYAREVLLAHRSPNTPVAIARALYRPDEHITLTTLGDMLNHPIDMLTTVIIGNHSSRNYNDWFITPRGYLGGLSKESDVENSQKI